MSVFPLCRNTNAANSCIVGRVSGAPKCGVEELKKALSGLPKDTYVYWNTWPPKNCYCPEEAIVRDIIEFAANKGVHVEPAPALQ